MLDINNNIIQVKTLMPKIPLEGKSHIERIGEIQWCINLHRKKHHKPQRSYSINIILRLTLLREAKLTMIVERA